MGPVCSSQARVPVPLPVALQPEEQEIANQLQQKFKDSLNGLAEVLRKTNQELINITQPQQMQQRQ